MSRLFASMAAGLALAGCGDPYSRGYGPGGQPPAGAVGGGWGRDYGEPHRSWWDGLWRPFGGRRRMDWRQPVSHNACPRPQTPAGVAPQFNDQQQEVRALRRRAFHGDFFAQLELGKRYEGWRPADKNLQDPIEAAVWYVMALANPAGYQPTQAGDPGSQAGTDDRGRPLGQDAAAPPPPDAFFDDCRAGEREQAYRRLDSLLAQMSSDERDKVRDRSVYVLASEGADGYRILSRLYDDRYGVFGEPIDNPDAQDALNEDADNQPAVSAQLFERNDVDAYIYNYLAMQTGDTAAYVILQDARWGRVADVAEARARRWTPPYEFYPPDSPQSGVPHTDESVVYDEVSEAALARMNALPFVHVSRALAYVHASQRVVWREGELPAHDARTFQAMIGHPLGDCLTPLEKVRAIQYAAVNGSPGAQLVLAVMYAQGVGTPTDFARAFYWFNQAERQGSPEAKFAVANFFSEGVSGVADQDKAKSVVYQLDAALSGFRPSERRLRAMLWRVSPGHRVGWGGYQPRVDDGYPPDAGPADGPPDGPPDARDDDPPPRHAAPPPHSHERRRPPPAVRHAHADKVARLASRAADAAPGLAGPPSKPAPDKGDAP